MLASTFNLHSNEVSSCLAYHLTVDLMKYTYNTLNDNFEMVTCGCNHCNQWLGRPHKLFHSAIQKLHVIRLKCPKFFAMYGLTVIQGTGHTFRPRS